MRTEFLVHSGVTWLLGCPQLVIPKYLRKKHGEADRPFKEYPVADPAGYGGPPALVGLGAPPSPTKTATTQTTQVATVVDRGDNHEIIKVALALLSLPEC